MKHTYLIPSAVALIPAIAAVALLTSSPTRSAEADTDAYRCTDSSFYFPVTGVVGWTYQDPASTDRDTDGHTTVHTGIDVFADAGSGAPVYAPADGQVARVYGSERVNLVLPGVTNEVNGEEGIEVYMSHMLHALTPGQKFNAGDVIGAQSGDHVHMSVGAFVGYDDREIGQTQDPSPYFQAALSFGTEHLSREDATYWCYDGAPVADAQVAIAPLAPLATEEPVEEVVANVVHVVAEGDTLSGIAELYGTTIEDIAAANTMADLDFLSIGQEITIPGTVAAAPSAEAASADATAAPAEDATTASGEYVVADGDTLSSIAEAFGTDVDTIISLNVFIDPDFLSIGDVLVMP